MAPAVRPGLARLILRCALAVLLLAAPAGPAAAQQPVDVELVLAADGSGSIDDGEFRFQREGYAAAITHPEVLNAIRAGAHGRIALAMIEWGDPSSQELIVDWMVISDEVSARAFADRLLAAPRKAWGFNSISNAVHKATEMILANGFDGLKKIIDVSGDGPQMNGRSLAEVRAAALAHGIVINALLVQREGSAPAMAGDRLRRHYKDDLIAGPGSFVMTTEEEGGFAVAIRQKLILELAGATPRQARMKAGR